MDGCFSIINHRNNNIVGYFVQKYNYFPKIGPETARITGVGNITEQNFAPYNIYKHN